MKGTPAIYLGRIVEKKNFRTFVYGSNDEKKIVESWEAYEAAMQSGIWFATVEDAKAMKEIAEEAEQNKEEVRAEPKPKPSLNPKPVLNLSNKKMKEPPQKAPILEDDKMGFEVTDENK